MSYLSQSNLQMFYGILKSSKNFQRHLTERSQEPDTPEKLKKNKASTCIIFRLET